MARAGLRADLHDEADGLVGVLRVGRGLDAEEPRVAVRDVEGVRRQHLRVVQHLQCADSFIINDPLFVVYHSLSIIYHLFSLFTSHLLSIFISIHCSLLFVHYFRT